MNPNKISLSNAIKEGLLLMGNNLRTLLPTFLIMASIMVVKTFLIFGLYDWSLIERLFRLRKIGVVLQPMVLIVRPHIWFIIFSFLILYSLYLFFYLGTIKIVFNLYDTGSSRLRILFSSLNILPKAFVTALVVYGLPFLVGFFIGLPIYLMKISISPSLALLFAFIVQLLITAYLTAVALWMYILVDKNIGYIQAIKQSYYLLKGNILKLTAIYILVRIATKINPYVDIITWPIIFLAEICILVVIYRQLANQGNAISYTAPEYL